MMNRPTQRDVAKIVAEQWFEKFPDYELDVDSLAKAIRWDNDTAKIMVCLSQDGWEVDENLYSDLEYLYSMIRDTLDEWVKKWVKHENIQPRFKVGQEITTTPLHRNQETRWRIEKIILDKAEYYATNPSMRAEESSRRAVFCFEQLEKALDECQT